MKTKKSKNKVVSVKITNKSLTAGVISKPCLVTLFEAITVSPNGSTQAPAEGLDLTGYSQYRLTLHLVGGQGSEFSIQEMFGPVGSVDQMAFDIGGGPIGPGGILNYRAGYRTTATSLSRSMALSTPCADRCATIIGPSGPQRYQLPSLAAPRNTSITSSAIALPSK